jgi:hypothetical protein
MFVLALIVGVCESKTTIQEHRKLHVREYIAVDADFNDYEKALIVEAAEMWQEATNNTVEFTFLYSYNPEFRFEHDDDTIVYPIVMKHLSEDDGFTQLMDMLVGGQIIGYYKKNEAIPIIYLVETRISSPDEYELTVAHEIAHSVGIGHLRQKGALMYPNITEIEGCITRYDVEAFCKIYGCDIDDMNYCLIGGALSCSIEETGPT